MTPSTSRDASSKETASLRRLLALGRIPIAILGVAAFFTFYNRFILNSNLENLRASLGALEQASGIGNAEAALVLLDQTLVTEMAKEEMDLTRLASLQYAQEALGSDRLDRPVDDIQAISGKVVEEEAQARPGFLSTLDTVVTGTQGVLRGVALLPRRIASGKLSTEIDSTRLQQAIASERRGRVSEAIPLYEELLRSYPRYADRAALRLRLGNLYLRAQSFNQARTQFQKTLQESVKPQELHAARAMLDRLGQVPRLQRQAQTLEKKLLPLSAGPDRQKLAFELGHLRLQLYEMEEAAEAFDLAATADPEGDLFYPSLLKQAWALQSIGRFDEATQVLGRVIRPDPRSSWAAAAYLQTAQIQKAQGQYEAALQIYDELLQQNSKAKSLVGLAIAQAGCTATYDLGDPERAGQYFNQLARHFPGSPLSDIGKDLSRIQTQKAALAVQSAAPFGIGSPLFGWIQNTLPVFVKTFSDRLAKYMDAVGEKEFTRKYTEAEFRNIVLQRVQERFPGQIRAVQVRIRPDGYSGSCSIHLGPLSFPLEGRLGIQLSGLRPHVVIHEMRVWRVPVVGPIRRHLENQANQAIDKLRLPIRVLEYEFGEGYCLIRVERVE